ncbi:MAG: glycosyltransferase [Patescibacteria group bacterium]|nr:glycosyltransferase [Patescibacteria group bacterium]
MRKAEIFVSVIAPVHDEAAALAGFAAEATDLLERDYANYELLIVDDGSDDGTSEAADRILASRKCVRYIRLARQYGREKAVMAGLDTVIGDYAVVMSASTDPVALIPQMVAQAAEGTGIVFGVRKDAGQGSFMSRIGARIFHWYCEKFLVIRMPRRMTSMAILSRQAINSLIRIKGKGNYLRLFGKYTGLASQEFAYDQEARPGAKPKTQNTGFRRKLETAVDIAVSNSSHPLRSVTYLGLAAGAINLLYMLYIVGIYLFKSDVQPGWTTSSLQSAIMFFFVFLILTVFAEYLGKLMNEVVPKETYTVADEKTSSTVLADTDQLNVVKRTEREKCEQTHA